MWFDWKYLSLLGKWSECAILWQPVAICKASFCAVWRHFYEDSLITGAHTGAAWSITDLPIAWYVRIIVFFCCPHVVPVKALRMLFQALTSTTWFRQWAAKVYIVSWVTSRILGCFWRGTTVLLIKICGCSRDWFGWGVNRVTVDYSGETMRSRSLNCSSVNLSPRICISGPMT